MADSFIIAKLLFSRLQLSSSVGMDASQVESDIAESIYESANSRQEILDKVIELLDPDDTPDKRYLKAKALSWSGVDRNREAIEALEKSIGDSVDSSNFSHMSHLYYFPEETNRNLVEMRIYFSGLHSQLVDKYLRDYQFDEALENAQIAYELTPFYTFSVIRVAECYIKRNELQNAKSFYEQVMADSYFNTNVSELSDLDKYFIESYKRVVSGHYKDLMLKIGRGYVYKPRPKKIVR